MFRFLRFFIGFCFLWGQLLFAAAPDLTLQIPMRDGMLLPADVYLPSPDAKNLPCLLLRNPAGRKTEPWISTYADLAKSGYAVVFQDTRSAIDFEGKTFPYFSDGWGKDQDGYDTVQWLSKHPLTNGKIGTFGFSAAGITQLMMAPSAPPALKCQYIGFALGSVYHHAIFSGGQILKSQVEGWLGWHAKDTGILNYIYNQPFYNDFWMSFDSLRKANHVSVPAFIYGGWYDPFLKGTLDAYLARENEGGEGAKGQQRLLIGPWEHYWPAIVHFGDFQVPKEGERLPFDLSPQRWFDFYLKDIDNHLQDLPKVIYYVMGPFDGTHSSGNRWRTAESWPVPSVETPFYLSADHKLVENKNAPAHQALTYLYDPRNPIPTIGGRNLFLESGPKDQKSIENREDILLFTSDPFPEDMEITGPIYAKLFFSSDQPDTEIVVRLTDVYPDGRSILIADGNCRIVFHEEWFLQSKPIDLPHEFTVDLWSTSIVFAKGHALRISVSSSSYPRYEKNFNIGLLGTNTGKFAIAKNTLHFGGEYGSRVLLPLVRKGEKWLVR